MTTARHGLPLLSAGQAQKEVTHNEALTMADQLMNPVAEQFGLETPPGGPQPGQTWIIGAAPTGDWAGRDGQIACWTPGGWRYVQPFEGLHIWLMDQRLWARREANGWSIGEVSAGEIRIGGVRVLGTRQPPIVEPAGGTTIDEAARTALAAVLQALRAHGIISP